MFKPKNLPVTISSIIVISLIVGWGMSMVLAVWQDPTATPPLNNVSAPINVSGTAQYKTGIVGFSTSGYDPNYGLTVGSGVKITNTGAQPSMYVEDMAGDTTPFIIDASGNAGIGITTPSQKLEVNGVAQAATFYASTGISTFNTTVAAGTVESNQFCLDDGANCITTWPASGTGTVTSITQGTGMSFSVNPITTTGTISNASGVLANKGLQVNASKNFGIIDCTFDNYIMKYDLATGTWACEADATGAGADGNNFTTGISFAGTSTKTLTLTRSGLADLTTTFTHTLDEACDVGCTTNQSIVTSGQVQAGNGAVTLQAGGAITGGTVNVSGSVVAGVNVQAGGSLIGADLSVSGDLAANNNSLTNCAWFSQAIGSELSCPAARQIVTGVKVTTTTFSINCCDL